MDLSIQQVADALGKSAHQVRYLIRTEQLPARKAGGRWKIRSEDLPRSDGQRRAAERKQERLRDAVEDALALPEKRTRYSIKDLKAFQIGLGIYQSAQQHLGGDHPVCAHLRAALEELALGCHRFRGGEKARCYAAARDHASRAGCALALSDAPAGEGLLEQLEQEWMPAFAGLLRRMERGRR